jgi:hypothetical protein
MPALQSFMVSIMSIRLWAAIEAPLARAITSNDSERPRPANGHQLKSPQAGRNNTIAIIPKMEMPASIRARFEAVLGDMSLAPQKIAGIRDRGIRISGDMAQVTGNKV